LTGNEYGGKVHGLQYIIPMKKNSVAGGAIDPGRLPLFGGPVAWITPK
jgi:hypothetical protein